MNQNVAAFDSVAYDQVKINLSESEAEVCKDEPITIHIPTLYDWFSFSASAYNPDKLVFT